jgi:phosphohistidine phosphatase
MKTLYLVRHAFAADQGPDYPTDEARPLTEEGAARFRVQVRGLRELDVQIDAVLASPLLRCQQTAHLMAAGLGGGIPVETLDALRPGGRVADVLEGLAPHRRAGALALVGHEPSIGYLASALIGATGPMPFKKGAACRIDVDAFPPRGAGMLVWMLPPKVMRRLGD